MVKSAVWTLIALALVLETPAAAQCCYGAQHVRATTEDGRFRVEARSLSGTGMPGPHGPYRFRFTSLVAKSGGGWTPVASFEKTFDTRDHFNLFLIPSPLGNGFLMQGPHEQSLTLYGPEGQILTRCLEGSDDLRLMKATWASKWSVNEKGERWFEARCPIHDGWILIKKGAEPETELFVPLGLPVERKDQGPADIERLHWLVRILERKTALGRDGSLRLDKSLSLLNTPQRARAISNLIALGPAALTRLRSAQQLEPLAPGAKEAIAGILRLSCGQLSLRNNRPLLRGLLTLKNPRLHRAVKARLRALGPNTKSRPSSRPESRKASGG